MKDQPYEYIQAFAGSGTIEVSGQYMQNTVTFTGLATGVITSEAKHIFGDSFEEVVNSMCDLTKRRTYHIRNTQLQALRFTHSEGGSFTVCIKQYYGIR